MRKIASGIVATASAVLLAATLSGCSYFYPNWGATGAPTTSASPTVSPTDSSQPTTSPSASSSPTTPPKKTAAVNIINLSNDGVSITAIAEITNISEDGGQCTLTVSGGGVTRAIVAKAEANVSTTQCYPLSIPKAFFSTSNLTAVVSYESDGYQGASQANSVPAP